ncbi:AfsR/SARP family transcriptional regulator [Micromonospora sp. DT4]|uniref:AfsR/SARP family transcriptional regulator n=1 Tax=Micromonospora sp. DT4 TaxID=3393438 RepID=UPI003CF0747C
MDALQLQIMGPLRIRRGETELNAGPRQQRCMLAVLMARVGRPIAIVDLIDLVWGPDPPASAVNIIHKYVGALRRLLEPGLPLRAPGSYLLRHSEGYRFVVGSATLDLVVFRRLVSSAKSKLAQGRPAEALDDYVDALFLCQGTAGGVLADTVAASAILAGIDGEFFDAVVAAAELAVQQGQPGRVLAPLRLAAEMGRLNEIVHASLVTTLAAQGHQAEALATFEAIRSRLAAELGIDPGPGLQHAQRRALTQAAMPEANDDVEPPQVRATLHPAQLPPDLPMFVGRERELATLTGLVSAGQAADRTSPLVVAMAGMGGVGKSTLSVHFAHLTAGRFPDGQLYLDFQGHLGEEKSLAAGDALRSLLYGLGIASVDVPDTADTRTGLYRSLTIGKRFLVVLDNVRDVAQVRPLLPNSPQSLVLVTSRQPLVGLAALEGAYLLNVDLPDLPTSRELLERRLTDLPRRTDVGRPETVDEIIELCGRLPLALAILAARMTARPQLSFGEVVAELRDGARRLHAFPGGRGVSDPRTAFSCSYRELSPAAARLFRLTSVTLSPGVSLASCTSLAGRTTAETEAALAELVEMGLITEHEDGRFTSHVLVRAYAEELFRETEPLPERQAAISRLLQHYLHSSFHAQVMLEPNRTPIEPPPPLPGVMPERPLTYSDAFRWFAVRREMLKEAVRVAADLGYAIVPWQLALTMQQYLQWAGYYQDWEDIMRWALRAARQHHDVVGEAHSLRSLAGARYSFGDNEEALRLLAEALQIYEKEGMRFEQALVHSNLHRVYSALCRHDIAIEHSRRALSLFRDLGNRRSENLSRFHQGKYLVDMRHFNEAIKVLTQVLEVNQQIGRGIEEGEIRNVIASNLAELGRIDEAVQQLELSAQASGRAGHRPNHFDALRQLTEVLMTIGDRDGARRALERAYAVLREFQGGGTDSLRTDLADLALQLGHGESDEQDVGEGQENSRS